MTNFSALEEQVLFERRHCADKPNKCKAEIAVPIINWWRLFFFLFSFFFLNREKIIEVEDVGTERVVHLNLILFPIRV